MRNPTSESAFLPTKTMFSKCILLFVFSVLCFPVFSTTGTISEPTDTVYQSLGKDTKPNEKESLIILYLETPHRAPVKLTETGLFCPSTQKLYWSKTDEQGQVRFLVPRNRRYQINVNKDDNVYSLNIPDYPNYTKKFGFTYLPRQITENQSSEDKAQLTGDTIYQEVSHTAKATKTKGIIKIELIDRKNRRLYNLRVTLRSHKTGIVYSTQTNAAGKALFFVPNNCKYDVGIQNNPKYDEVELPDIPGISSGKMLYYQEATIRETEKNDTITQQLPSNVVATTARTLIIATITDLNHNPLPNEKFVLDALKTGKTYFARTDKNGVATLLIPKGDNYFVSFEFEAKIDSFYIKKDMNIRRHEIDYQYIGSKTMKRRIAERKRRLEIRDSLFKLKRYRDSIDRVYYRKHHFLYQLDLDENKDTVIKRIEERAMHDREMLKKDPKFFEKSGKEINAVFYRMRNQWKNKIIVTDITGSMYPYIDQILIWHALKVMTDENRTYFFFNDGDRTPDHKKVMGKTGGIYFTEGKTMTALLDRMSDAMHAGGGGDGPENDIEAMLEAQKKWSANTEIILIADNYSDVKDLVLLQQLKIPVRIVLCGADYAVNEHYLEIAYKTGGSVHTIEADIMNLARMVDGKTVTIGGNTYKLLRGKFIKISKM